MSHGLEQFEGKTSWFGRKAGWHQLGTVIDQSLPFMEVLELAHLKDWNQRLEPVTFVNNGENVIVDDSFVVVRDNPYTGNAEGLGTVGKVYDPIQIEAMQELVDAVCRQGMGTIDTAGSINDGKRVFLNIAFEGDLKIGGTDLIHRNFVMVKNNDGKGALRGINTPTRVVCQNTLQMALSDGKQHVSIRHTKNAKSAITEACMLLEQANTFMDAFSVEAEKMINTALDEEEFWKIADAVFGEPDPESTRSLNAHANRTDALAFLLHDAVTQDGIRDTAWGGYNAITEYVDHFMPVNGSGGDEIKATQLRAERAVTDPKTIGFKNKAWELLSV